MIPLLLLAGSAVGLQAKAAPIWQWSEGHQIELSIRDRNPDGEYTVTFVVVDPHEQKAFLTRLVVGDNWSSATFPKEFSRDLMPGTYHWYGCVGGVPAVEGGFTYSVNRGLVRLQTSLNDGPSKKHGSSLDPQAAKRLRC